MQKFIQKYTIVALLEDNLEGFEYPSSNWPLHTTIADTFSIEGDIKELIKELATLAKRHHHLKTIATHDEYFGPEYKTQVTILDMNEEIIEFHNAIVGLLKNFGVLFNDPQYTESGFRAHSTVQDHARINLGETVVLKNLALVDMFPNKDPYKRKILKIFKLDR